MDTRINTLDSLGNQYRSWDLPSDADTRWLLEQGIPETWLYTPWPISSSTVSIDRRCFYEDPEGDRAFIFPCSDCGSIVDWIAWCPKNNRLASWLGIGFCIGDVDGIFNPATYLAGDALRIHADPIEWLKSARAGIVIVRPDLAGAYLGRVQRIVFAA